MWSVLLFLSVIFWPCFFLKGNLTYVVDLQVLTVLFYNYFVETFFPTITIDNKLLGFLYFQFDLRILPEHYS